MTAVSSHSQQQKAQNPEFKASLLKRVGWGGVFRLALGAVICAINVAFYTILPLAGLGLLPFMFFGCVLLMTGIADDAGYYR